jgi:hypothetical protein
MTAPHMLMKLWEFPPEDFPAWCDLVGSPEVHTHADYLTLIAAVQADQERQGRTVLRVRLTVQEMLLRLAESGLTNTADNRALIVARTGTP